VIKLAPVVRELEARPGRFRTLNAASGQHTDLVHPFARELGVRMDHDLQVGTERQNPTEVCHRALAALAQLLSSERPDALLVEGDTTTAFAGALAGFYHGVPVGHVEAGLRSGNLESPFPEELNRRLISQLASFHFAPTQRNVEALLGEGISADRIALTGNPVVDSLQWAREHTTPSARAQALLRDVADTRLVVLTTHRRESFGPVMEGRMRVLRRFVERHSDTTLVFPVHPNPEVSDCATRQLGSAARVFLVEPLEYLDFVHLLSNAWLIVTDSGGVQEEAPSLGRPVLVIRENTERPEALEAGTARLVGESPDALEAMLEESYSDLGWFERASLRGNPFGRGDSGRRIADALEAFLDRLGSAK
jgi:UDP-N-acetylglucosamine 2-epimerase (non-hydrolysing)